MYPYGHHMMYGGFHWFWPALVILCVVVFLVFVLRRHCMYGYGCGMRGYYHRRDEKRYPSYHELVEEVNGLKEEIKRLKEKPAEPEPRTE
ncbi:MAG: hypothetical protein HPY50_09275 [Firmicutes bacterium]|nr:hypothetical protein [Bacillota bacterium]